MSADIQVIDRYGWWASLKHGGLLVSPSKLAEFFPEDLDPLPRHLADRLRRDVMRVRDGDEKHLSTLLGTVLEEVLELSKEGWLKSGAVDSGWSQRAITREIIKPRRVWRGANGSVLPIFVGSTEIHGAESGAGVARIGVGRGRRSVSRVIEWLRKANQRVALLTNGRQWRLIHAGADYDAWAEWDTDLWFQEGTPGQQVTALRILLGYEALTAPKQGEPPPLVAAIQSSRQGQAELSSMLGERVRQAVELLIRESVDAARDLGENQERPVAPRDIYIAATRMIMRCVVILFAEARDLLPRDNPVYHSSYGIQGLREQLDRFAGGRAAERLRHAYGAWPRLLALFRLVYEGSAHQALPVPRYSGGLFAPSDPDSQDPLRRALGVFENPRRVPSDAVVHRILELLTRSRVKVRQGRVSTWVEAPVDFSDLSSEYIGILYEGLLDYELRQADAENPIVFLNVGDQPALPLPRLEQMDTSSLASLVEKLRQNTGASAAGSEDEDGEEEDSEEAEAIEDETEEGGEGVSPEPELVDVFEDDRVQHLRERARAWAVRAVKAGGLVPQPRGRRNDAALAEYERAVVRVADTLIFRVVLPGEWFLVRWGGTRKGTGTFYTRPQLAIPTAQRTLRPLAYDPVTAATDEEATTSQRTEWTPKKPEEILALKVCDPAMGSGSFLVAALRFLTDALYESLHYHGRIEEHDGSTLCQLIYGERSHVSLVEPLPIPVSHPEFEERLKARLKRHVVERCIYGVDFDPLAVELSRLSLWVETMDRSLPFGFLDHKLKHGNALVGCWFDRFKDYPVMAWEREGGDKSHDRFVHHFREYEVTRGKKAGEIELKGDVWTQAIKDLKNDVIKPEMVAYITAAREDVFEFRREGYTEEGLHDDALAVFEELHNLPVHDSEGRAKLYQEKIVNNPALKRLKGAFDTWCAIWFWPGDALDFAVTPQNFYEPLEEARKIVVELAARHGFFHWELEFPDVFAKEKAGFDAIVGNPPWEIQKPNSKEFFSNVDPLYRTYGKQDALRHQIEYFEKSKETEDGWLTYNAQLKSLSNWVKHGGYPFGDEAAGGDTFNFVRATKESAQLHSQWRKQRSSRHGYADPQHPYRYQGSADINTYKMFSELAHALLEEQGRVGMIVPSGIYTDKGSTALRSLFLSRCRWEWLFGFENRDGIFDIHRSFKFCPVIVQKGGSTKRIQAAFMRRRLADWEEAEQFVFEYPREQVEQFSPQSKVVLEIRNSRDLEILTKMYGGGILLGSRSNEGWDIQYAREFDMTTDSGLFPPVTKWQSRGYQPDEYGHWLKGNWQPYVGPTSILDRENGLVLSSDNKSAIYINDVEDIALPLYEGRMVGQFDFSQKGWVSGKGRTAIWRDIPFDDKVVEPQYVMSKGNFAQSTAFKGLKAGFLAVGSATNSRSMFCTSLHQVPCGNAVPSLRVGTGGFQSLALVGILNSYSYDFSLRSRLGGINLNYFVVEETPLIKRSCLTEQDNVLLIAAQLCWPHASFALPWSKFISDNTSKYLQRQWKQLWAVTLHERLRLRCILDAIIAELYGLSVTDLEWLLRDCDYPVEVLRNSEFTRTLDPKGFWRIDKTIEPELRHTILSLVAFNELKNVGLDSFLSLNEGEGWMLPESLCLADYGLGHDERAEGSQPVASRLGPRFMPWQLRGTPEESWEECRRHAEILRMMRGDEDEELEEQSSGEDSSDTPVDLFGNPLSTDLFGNVLTTKAKRKK